MKIITANNKKQLNISKKEWTDLGKKAGWKVTQYEDPDSDKHENIVKAYQLAFNEIKELVPYIENRLGRFGIPVEEFEKITSIMATLKDKEGMINDGIQYTTDEFGSEQLTEEWGTSGAPNNGLILGQ